MTSCEAGILSLYRAIRGEFPLSLLVHGLLSPTPSRQSVLTEGVVTFRGGYSCGRRTIGGFTLAEVVITIGVLALVTLAVVRGYVQCSQRAEWSAYSLAAQSLASQGVEQARAAKWDPQAWPPGIGPGLADELGVTNYVQTNLTLDLPVAGGQVEYATNLVSVTVVSINPPLRQIRTDCVWLFRSSGRVFTNTVITLRAPDQ